MTSSLTVNPDDDIDPFDGRDETEQERNDRNWGEIMQELRVIQTGTQLLTGFLLTLPFQARFATLNGYEVVTYLVLVAIAVTATLLALLPVAFHRALFRHRAKGSMVLLANRVLQFAIVAVALTLTGTITLIIDVVIGRAEGIIVGGVTLAVLASCWFALPIVLRRRWDRT